MIRKLILLALALTLAGCYIGRRAEDLELARVPRGAHVQLQLRDGAMNGELLEVQDSALLVRSGERIALVPYGAIRQGRVETMSGDVLLGGRPDSRRRYRMQRLSRYPGGLTAETRQALLAAYGQSEIEVIRP